MKTRSVRKARLKHIQATKNLDEARARGYIRMFGSSPTPFSTPGPPSSPTRRNHHMILLSRTPSVGTSLLAEDEIKVEPRDSTAEPPGPTGTPARNLSAPPTGGSPPPTEGTGPLIGHVRRSVTGDVNTPAPDSDRELSEMPEPEHLRSVAELDCATRRVGRRQMSILLADQAKADAQLKKSRDDWLEALLDPSITLGEEPTKHEIHEHNLACSTLELKRIQRDRDGELCNHWKKHVETARIVHAQPGQLGHVMGLALRVSVWLGGPEFYPGLGLVRPPGGPLMGDLQADPSLPPTLHSSDCSPRTRPLLSPFYNSHTAFTTECIAPRS